MDNRSTSEQQFMDRPIRRRSSANDFEFQHSPDFIPREMCFRCARPASQCHCSTIPSVENKTELLLVQHIRERKHPFNTARMVKASLDKVVSIVDYAEEMPNYDGLLHSNAGLLYPSKSSKLLDDQATGALPSQLVVLDGTWHHAKRLYKCWPALERMSHYRLAPTTPGQYKIRLEPDEHSLSTVEAVVAAYRVLEPELNGLDELLNSFQTMVANQLAHPSANYERSTLPRKKNVNIPRALVNDYDRLVVAYGEAAPEEDGRWNRDPNRPPVYWVAKRLATDDRFSMFIEPPNPITGQYLKHFDLEQRCFESAASIERFRHAWEDFSRPNDILVVYNSNTLRLIRAAGLTFEESIELKSINFDPTNKYSSLGEMFSDLNFKTHPIEFPGRAGLRIRNAVTLVDMLKSQLASMSP